MDKKNNKMDDFTVALEGLSTSDKPRPSISIQNNIVVNNQKNQAGESLKALLILSVFLSCVFVISITGHAHAEPSAKTVIINQEGSSLESFKRQVVKLFENNPLDFTL